MKIEICCGSIEDVMTADRCKVDRIELNSALELGGLTPSLGTLVEAKKKTDIPICCMVRPRPAGFCYTRREFETMLTDAEMLLKAGADGIVFGFLYKDATIHLEYTKQMVQLIKKYGKEAIFHKAYDECFDLEKALQQLIECKVDRVLTGGGKVAIEVGSKVLGVLQDKYGHLIQILPGGGVRDFNVQEIIKNSHCRQIHMTAKKIYYDRGDYYAVDGGNLETIRKQILNMKK